MSTRPQPVWHELALGQAGLVSRAQLLAVGAGDAEVRWAVDSGRLVRVLPGVYSTTAGAPRDVQRVWAALLWSGAEAAVSGRAALWLYGVRTVLPARVEVTVPAARRVRAPRPSAPAGPGPNSAWAAVAVRSRSRHADLVHPTLTPPRLRLEEVVLDETGPCRTGEAVGLLLDVVQTRLTTPARLLAALQRRPRHPRRQLVEDLLRDAAAGVHSALERQYLHHVERGHRLPSGVRNEPERSVVQEGGRSYRRVRYRDVRYPWGVLVELDGLAAHRGREMPDRTRDREALPSGAAVLRYGWHEVVGDPCAVAAEVAAVLRRRGWRGRAVPCDAGGCAVDVARDREDSPLPGRQ